MEAPGEEIRRFNPVVDSDGSGIDSPDVVCPECKDPLAAPHSCGCHRRQR